MPAVAPAKKAQAIQQKPTQSVRKTINLNEWDKPKEANDSTSTPSHSIAEQTEAFTEEQLRSTWQEFVNNAIRNSDLRKTNILKGRAIAIENNTIKIQLDNTIQLEHLNGFKEELMLFIRGKLKNSSIVLEAAVVEINTDNLLYTSEDKYRHLAKKNPLLDTLKQTLGLETGF